jgi:hypothetical protein
MFSPEGGGVGRNTRGTLHVAVKDAKSLPNMDKSDETDGFVKLYLLPEKNPKGKRKTTVIKNSLNPVWEEKFSYDRVTADELSSTRVLEVTVWDYDRGSSNEFVGGLRLGPAPHRVKHRKGWVDSNQEEANHWEAVLASPGQWVEHWHSLRASMDTREIDLSDLSSFLEAEGEGKDTKEEAGLQGVSDLSSKREGDVSAKIPLSAIAGGAGSMKEKGEGEKKRSGDEFRRVSVGNQKEGVERERSEDEFRRVSVGNQSSASHEVGLSSQVCSLLGSAGYWYGPETNHFRARYFTG